MRVNASASFLASQSSRSLDAMAASSVYRWTLASKLDPISFPTRAVSRTLLTSDLSCRRRVDKMSNLARYEPNNNN